MTFFAGTVLTLGGMIVLLNSCAPPNRSAEFVSNYKSEMMKIGNAGPAAGSEGEKQAIERFTNFLKNIDNKQYISENTGKTYSRDAYLNDTLTTHYGVDKIRAYFEKTSESLKDSTVTIDDVVRSGSDHYIRWTMTLTAPALAKGEPVHSIGISQVRFDSEGKVAMHQDFWDSGENFFGKLPVAGGITGFIRKRLQ